VVIQPLNNLCPPSSLGNASSSGDSAAPSADEQSRPLQEINIAVPSSLANITQQVAADDGPFVPEHAIERGFPKHHRREVLALKRLVSSFEK